MECVHIGAHIAYGLPTEIYLIYRSGSAVIDVKKNNCKLNSMLNMQSCTFIRHFGDYLYVHNT